MARFYKDGNGKEYEEILGEGSISNPSSVVKVIDKLMEKEQMQEILEYEIAEHEIGFEQEPPFREGFKLGLSVMLWMQGAGMCKSVTINKRDIRYRKTWRRKVARLFGITPIDFADDFNDKE